MLRHSSQSKRKTPEQHDTEACDEQDTKKSRPTDDCHMLRAYARDQDAWFMLLHTYLNLVDISNLYATSHTCKNWISQPSRMMRESMKRASLVSPASLQIMAKCNWVRPFIAQLQVNIQPSAGAARTRFSDVTSALAQFPRLKRLRLQLSSGDAGRVEMRECFQAIKDIQHLELVMTSPSPSAFLALLTHATTTTTTKSAVASAFLALDTLTQLESFSVVNLADEPPNGLDFESLARLPSLTKFSLRLSQGHIFHADAAQSKCLAGCKQLVDLRCGVWSLPFHVEYPLLIGATAIEKKLCKTTLYTRIGAIAGDSKIQRLDLEGTVISSQMWGHLSQMHSLTELAPAAWRSDITSEQWSSLAKFHQLRSFSLSSPGRQHGFRFKPIVAEIVLPHLLQCDQLQRLSIKSVNISRSQLAEIVARLTNLEYLSMRSMEVESLEPLALANKLQSLSLSSCNQPGALNSREGFPSIPQLTSLRLHDRVRITAEAAAPLNAALQQRLPKLKIACFKQNLLLAAPE